MPGRWRPRLRHNVSASLDHPTYRALLEAVRLSWASRPSSQADIVREGIRLVHGVLTGRLILTRAVSPEEG